ncbi:TetR/AcrR family transcriptional regulator [Agreia sp. Leaf335]|uniref:TetR/AcrR family transcriptional regulator n=1 Tax=Agreia sp. Leaf335 TaxID=1736340 RepID=UPI00138EFCF2|nr:TetR/AcrR family transcriptional regulator [Agreia sp. Leaf335]
MTISVEAGVRKDLRIPKERRSELRREAVIDVARELLIQRGSLNTGIPQVTALSNLGSGTCYRYFSDREDLILGVCQNDLDRLLREFTRHLAIGDLKTTEQVIHTALSALVSIRGSRKGAVPLSLSSTFNREEPRDDIRIYVETITSVLDQIFPRPEVGASSLQLTIVITLADAFLTKNLPAMGNDAALAAVLLFARIGIKATNSSLAGS